MTDTNTILVVGSVDCNDGVSTALTAMTLGKPLRSASEYGGLGIDIAKVGAVDMSGLVESRFTVNVTAASVDAVSAIVASIAAEVRDLADITVGLAGSSYTGTLKVRIGECIEIPLAKPMDSALMNAHWTRVEIIVRRASYVFSAAETLHDNASFDCPALIDLSAQTGQFAPPLDLLLDAGALELSACYIGHTANKLAVIGDFITQAVDAMTWAKTGGGAATGTTGIETHGYPNGVGNTAWLTHDAIGDTASVDVTDLLPGEYLVFANVRYETGAAGVEIRQEYGQWTPITTSGLRLLPLGVVSLPTQVVRGSAAATLDVSIRGNGTNYAVVNYVALLPVSRGLIGWQVTSGHAHRVLWADGTMYVEDVAKLNEAYGSGVPLRVLGGQLVVLAEQATPAPTTHLHVTVSATPRWEQFPNL